jgi:hypothetical protein
LSHAKRGSHFLDQVAAEDCVPSLNHFVVGAAGSWVILMVAILAKG